MLREKFQVTNVPYRGAAPALADLVAGQVQAKLDNYTQSAQLIADRKLNVLAVTGARRLKQFPDVPAVAEQLRGFEGYLWMGVVAPAATPDAVVQKLATAARRFVALPEIQARFDKDGVEPVGNGPDEFGAQIANEIAVWRDSPRRPRSRSIEILGEERLGARLGVGRSRGIVGEMVRLAGAGDGAVGQLVVEAVIGVGVVDRLDQLGPRETHWSTRQRSSGVQSSLSPARISTGTSMPVSDDGLQPG